MNPAYVSPLLERTLSAAYWFYDAFFPLDDRTPPLQSQLEVSIPELRWVALRSDNDFTYRFSTLTLKRPVPSGVKTVQVVAPAGDYVSFAQIQLALPRALSHPLQRSDFLVPTPLWPTTALRPPVGETAVRGRIWSNTAQPVSGLKVEMWPGPAPKPPGTPFTFTNTNGDFLFRFPLLKVPPPKVPPDPAVQMSISLNGGAVGVVPSASVPVLFGRTQIIQFQRL